MFGVTPLLPAFGRDYKSKAAAQADFDAGKDFISAYGSYINREHWKFHPGQQIEVRSANKRKVWMLTAPAVE